MRAAIDPRTNQVTAVVEHWAGPAGHLVDMAVGPDGSVYYIAYDDGCFDRASYIGGEQGLVVTPTNVWIGDGKPAAVMVRLSTRPTHGAGIAVSVSRTAGDADVNVVSGNMLQFNDTNWNQAQRVTVASGFDLDTSNDVATVTVSAPDFAPELVTVHARDEAGPDLVLPPPPWPSTRGAAAALRLRCLASRSCPCSSASNAQRGPRKSP